MSASGGDPREVPAGLRPLLAAFREGKRGALGRAITLVENEGPGFQELLHAVAAVRASKGEAASSGAGGRAAGPVA